MRGAGLRTCLCICIPAFTLQYVIDQLMLPAQHTAAPEAGQGEGLTLAKIFFEIGLDHVLGGKPDESAPVSGWGITVSRRS